MLQYKREADYRERGNSSDERCSGRLLPDIPRSLFKECEPQLLRRQFAEAFLSITDSLLVK